jgi:hypothetical protein
VDCSFIESMGAYDLQLLSRNVEKSIFKGSSHDVSSVQRVSKDFLYSARQCPMDRQSSNGLANLQQ